MVLEFQIIEPKIEQLPLKLFVFRNFFGKTCLVLDDIEDMIDLVSDFSKLLLHVSRNGQRRGRLVLAFDHLAVDEEGQLEEPRVGDGSGKVRAVEQRDLRTSKEDMTQVQ